MKILLIQFRPNPVIADHEFGLMVSASGHPADSFVRVNALEDACDSSLLTGVDAIMIGGSGDYLISQGDIPEVIERVGSLLVAARTQQIPMLGICFGAQIMTKSFGGQVTLDASRQETGTFEITKTDAAAEDPLLASFPKQFDAQLGHKDHLTGLPEGAILLASSERSPHQVYTFAGEPTYAVLYHPELDRESMLYRLNYYAREYGVSPDVLAAAEKNIRPAPIAAQTIRVFLDQIVVQGKRPKIAETVPALV